jgi:PadR family transcriptional regulator AphA
MTDFKAPRLSQAEWLVLCLVCEEPTYGLALVQLLAPTGSLGQIWRVPKAMVYRALPRLEAGDLIRVIREERSPAGPVRSLYQVTKPGRAAAQAWLARPACHGRDVRSELLVKLALLDRVGADPSRLLHDQLSELLPVAAALDRQLRGATGLERTVLLWRRESMAGTMRFLQLMVAPAQEQPGSLAQIPVPRPEGLPWSQ